MLSEIFILISLIFVAISSIGVLWSYHEVIKSEKRFLKYLKESENYENKNETGLEMVYVHSEDLKNIKQME